MKEVKPCPFCGGEATIIDHWPDEPTGFIVRCMRCGMETPHFEDDNAEAAVNFWNRRAEEPKEP